jgi:hypothetical protein
MKALLRPSGLALTLVVSLGLVTTISAPAVPRSGLVAAEALASPSTSRTVGSSAASGVVTNNGRVEAGADVVLLAWPSQKVLDRVGEGGTAPLHVAGTASTDDNGRFSIDVDPARLPAWTKDRKGLVDLEVQVANDSRQLYFSYTVVAVPSRQRAGAGTSWAALASASASRRLAAPNLRFDLGRATAWDVANNPATWLDGRGKPYGKARGEQAAKVAVTKRTGRMASLMRRLDDCQATVGPLIPNLKEHFLNVYAWWGAKGKVTQSAGVDHTLGVGVKASGSSSWSAAGTNTESFSASASQANVVNSSAWNRVNYRDYGNTCSVLTYRRPVGFYDLLSNDWAPVSHPRFTASCATKLKGADWDTGSARNRTYGTGMDIGPISVSAQSGYTAQMNLHFDFDRKSRICGNSDEGLVHSSEVETHAP